MRQAVTTVQYVFAGIGGFMGWFLGGLDGFLYALLMFVVIDYVTGLMAAFVQKKVSSEVGFKGICKKVVNFCLVGIGHVLIRRSFRTEVYSAPQSFSFTYPMREFPLLRMLPLSDFRFQRS